MPEETFTERMQAKTLGRSDIPLKRGQNYNFPLRHYATPNGDIVQLQSDPQNRALYADLGFHLLAETPARGESLSEVEEWERIERPRVLVEQRRKAELINAIRKADARDPTLSVLIDLQTIDGESIESLEAIVTDIRSHGTPIRVMSTKFKDEPLPELLRGVETNQTNALEDLQRKLEAPGAHATTMQGTGKDPIDEARRRSSRP